MTQTQKLHPGSDFPNIQASNLIGDLVDIGAPAEGCDWKMVVVYRGRHCPLCTKYLNQLEGLRQRLFDNGVDLVGVSADSAAQLEKHLENLEVTFPLLHGLSVEQMQQLGLYVSVPRFEQETDHLFPEPGLFVLNEHNQVQVVDISNSPFVRPELGALVSGLEWIRNPENSYPIRGTHR